MSELFPHKIDSNESIQMPNHTKRIGRELAMLYLFTLETSDNSLNFERNEVFDNTAMIMNWKNNRVFRKGKEYAEQLLDVVSINSSEVDDRICQLSENWDWERLNLVDRNIMRVAVGEMLFIPEVPPVVSINEAVEIAMDYSGSNSGNFINGVLNAVKEQLNRPAREGLERS